MKPSCEPLLTSTSISTTTNAFRSVLELKPRWRSGLKLWLLILLCNSQLLRTRESSSTRPNLQNNETRKFCIDTSAAIQNLRVPRHRSAVHLFYLFCLSTLTGADHFQGTAAVIFSLCLGCLLRLISAYRFIEVSCKRNLLLSFLTAGLLIKGTTR